MTHTDPFPAKSRPVSREYLCTVILFTLSRAAPRAKTDPWRRVWKKRRFMESNFVRSTPTKAGDEGGAPAALDKGDPNYDDDAEKEASKK